MINMSSSDQIISIIVLIIFIVIDVLIIFNIIKIQKSINKINKKNRVLLKNITGNTTTVKKIKKYHSLKDKETIDYLQKLNNKDEE